MTTVKRLWLLIIGAHIIALANVKARPQSPLPENEVTIVDDKAQSASEVSSTVTSASESTTQTFVETTITSTDSTASPTESITLASTNVVETSSTTMAQASTFTSQKPSLAGTDDSDEQQLSGPVVKSSGGEAEDKEVKPSTAMATEPIATTSKATKTPTTEMDMRRCWTNSNGNGSARWIEEGGQVDRSGLYYECRDGKLIAAGCLAENGQRAPLNGTLVSGSYLVQCMPWSGFARQIPVGCAPENQQGKTFMEGDSWVEADKMTWWQCVVNGPMQGGCVDPPTNDKVQVGDRVDRGATTYECRYRQDEGFRLVPVGCVFNSQIFNETHYKIGQTWENDDFVFYCKKQTAPEKIKTRRQDVSSPTCIDCILRNQILADMNEKSVQIQTAKCEKLIVPTGNVLCGEDEKFGE